MVFHGPHLAPRNPRLANQSTWNAGHLPLISRRIPPDTRCSMRALSIRQPYAELILRGIKTVELRSRSTRIVGERFYIYASKGSGVRVQGSGKYKLWSDDLRVAAPPPPKWMIELAEQVGMIEP